MKKEIRHFIKNCGLVSLDTQTFPGDEKFYLNIYDEDEFNEDDEWEQFEIKKSELPAIISFVVFHNIKAFFKYHLF